MACKDWSCPLLDSGQFARNFKLGPVLLACRVFGQSHRIASLAGRLSVIRGLRILLQVGKHGIIIEFNDPDYNTRRSATYLPEVAAHEGMSTVLFVDKYSSSFHCHVKSSDLPGIQSSGADYPLPYLVDLPMFSRNFCRCCC